MHSMHGASGIWTSDELSSNTEDLLISFLYLWPGYQDCNLCTWQTCVANATVHLPDIANSTVHLPDMCERIRYP